MCFVGFSLFIRSPGIKCKVFWIAVKHDNVNLLKALLFLTECRYSVIYSSIVERESILFKAYITNLLLPDKFHALQI
jgi:hypothetical protein